MKNFIYFSVTKNNILISCLTKLIHVLSIFCLSYSDEIENFEMQLEKEEKRLHDLEGDHNKSLADFEKSQKKIKKLEAKTSRYEEQVEGLQHELEAKNELVSWKPFCYFKMIVSMYLKMEGLRSLCQSF